MELYHLKLYISTKLTKYVFSNALRLFSLSGNGTVSYSQAHKLTKIKYTPP